MPDRKGNIYSRNILLIGSILALLVSLGWGPAFFSDSDQKAEAARIYRIFEAKEKVILSEMDRLASQVESGKTGKELWLQPGNDIPENSGIYFTISKGDSLVFWTSSLVAFENKYEKIKPEGMLKKMPTGWFYIFTRQAKAYNITGYMLIKRDFPYQNKYISSSFQDDFRLSDQCEVITDERPGTIQVFCHEGKFHFGIQFKNKQNGTSREAIPSLLFFLLFIVLLSAHFNRWITGQKFSPWIKFGRAFLFAGSFYLVLNYLKLPSEVYNDKLFTPTHFAWRNQLSSLGDYLLISFFLVFIAQSFFVIFRKEQIQNPFSYRNAGMFLVASGYFIVSAGLFLVLLNNSDISLELYSNYSLSFPNIIASGCIALQMIGLGAILLRVRCAVHSSKRSFSFFLPNILSLAIILLLGFVLGFKMPLAAIVVYTTLLIILNYTGTDLLSKYKLSFLLVFGLLIAFGLNLTALGELALRKSKIQQVMAVNLASERDPAAEMFLSDFEAKVRKDSVIHSFLTPPYQNLEKYLKENYFTGFWKNYDLQITVCSASDSVFITDERRRYPCYDFFGKLKESKGVQLPGSKFYLMDRLNGRTSYLGELSIADLKSNRQLSAFIELNSKIVPEGKGYPQLLMDQQAVRRNRDASYSYAKYFDKKLVDRGGSYLYDPHFNEDVVPDKDFTFYQKGGFNHCVYIRGESNYVVVSYPIESWVEKGRGFPPMFLLIYLLGFAWILLNQRWKLITVDRIELRGKIQLTLVATLLISLFLIGLGLVNYNYKEFQRSMKENLDQKVRAISSELGLRIGNTMKPDTLHDFLGDQLVEISDITWTDINVYDLKGRMLASSRYEIFEHGLTSGRMNPEAFRVMNFQGNATFLHNENLGKMEFFSVYAPLFNRTDDLVGYVNLPYFNRQDEFRRQVSGFIAAFVNLYIFLVLITMVIALIISTKLTVPLLQIEQKLKGIAFGKPNAEIEYQGEDEIGRLVKAYNKKVAELAESADLLARSERESAWKEMARQIAHEINNPLTPMKLNIQYLQKIKDEGSPHFDDYFNRVTRMLVAQIDALSEIASAFSDFARMPSSHIERVELSGLVREVATLFDSPEEYIMQVSYPEEPVYVSGDRDQLRRALVNIIRNATQAIQNQSNGLILIGFNEMDHQVRITVKDNGSGIPEADRNRLFEPNFTTKSGGMGLGLAITKSILENYKAEISFQCQQGETAFFIDFPKYSEVNQTKG
jgi:two-component system, NtrC family, nitrogen regulation sensor histidine kinase NtrY